MATLRDSVAQLYTPIYDEFMLGVFDEPTQVHPQIFKVIDDNTKQYLVDDLSGLGIWESASEGEGGGYEDLTLGYPKTYTQGKFWKKFQVSFEAVDHDEYALLKRESDAKEMGRGGRAKVEKDCANTISNMFTVAGPDGQYGFDTDHPKNRDETGSLYDNLLTGAFSHDNLELAETQIANNLFSMAGLPIEPPEDPIILHPPALRGAVQRVLSERADERPGTTNRDINRFAGMYRRVEWRYLAPWAGGSSTAWFIIFPSLGFFKIVWTARPHFTAWVDEDSEYYKFKGRMLYAQGYDNWRGSFGSTGV